MNNCIQCHGETGRGDGPLASTLPIPPANLYDHVPFHPDQFFFGVMTNGLSGVMPAFENVLSEDGPLEHPQLPARAVRPATGRPATQ